jgi:hypothetical protein
MVKHQLTMSPYGQWRNDEQLVATIDKMLAAMNFLASKLSEEDRKIYLNHLLGPKAQEAQPK